MSEASLRAEPIRVGENATASSAPGCYHCGAELPSPGARACAECGRRQTRTCFCGTTIARGPVVCPQCGTDWTKVRRRSRRSSRTGDRGLLKHAFAGGAVALGAAAILYGVHLWGLPAAKDAASSVGPVLGGVWHVLADNALVLGAVAAVFAVGALAGVARYYMRGSRRGASGRRAETRQ